jgi:hypothetical protein
VTANYSPGIQVETSGGTLSAIGSRTLYRIGCSNHEGCSGQLHLHSRSITTAMCDHCRYPIHDLRQLLRRRAINFRAASRAVRLHESHDQQLGSELDQQSVCDGQRHYRNSSGRRMWQLDRCLCGRRRHATKQSSALHNLPVSWRFVDCSLERGGVLCKIPPPLRVTIPSA